jgi:ATP-dependent Clp protease protease subunit
MPIGQKITYQVADNVVVVPTYTPSPQRTIQWIGGVNGALLADITEQILSLLSDNALDPIHLVVTSHGGPTGIGMSFYDSMRSVYKPVLYTIGSGDVDSSGIIVFLAGERRYITPNTTLLLHLAGRTFDSPKRFTTPEMESIVKEDKLKDFQYASVIADRSGGHMNVQQVLDLMANNTVLTPQDAVDLGIAHSILQ